MLLYDCFAARSRYPAASLEQTVSYPGPSDLTAGQQLESPVNLSRSHAGASTSDAFANGRKLPTVRYDAGTLESILSKTEMRRMRTTNTPALATVGLAKPNW